MSADNGIYIAKFPDGFRVTHAQAIENIDYFPAGSKERKEELKSYFGDSKVFETQELALKEACKIEREFFNDPDNMCPIIEYGTCFVGEYESFDDI